MQTEMYVNDVVGIVTRINHMRCQGGTSLGETFNERPQLKKPDKYAISDAEIRATEYEFKKFSMEMKKHAFKADLTRKAGAIERLRRSKENSCEISSLQEVHKLLDNSYDKWMKCAKNTQRKYITEFIHRRYGINTKLPTMRKQKGNVMNTIELDNVHVTKDTYSESDIDIKVNIKAKKQTKRKTVVPELPEEAIEELKIAMDNWKEHLYDNTDMIRYDPSKRQIIDMNLLPGGEEEEDTTDNDD
jgi:hypothetical protein